MMSCRLHHLQLLLLGAFGAAGLHGAHQASGAAAAGPRYFWNVASMNNSVIEANLTAAGCVHAARREPLSTWSPQC
jgi:hypothetical protein